MNNNVTHCKGMTASGNPCKSKPGSSGYCHLHDPELKRQAEEEERRIQEEEEALIHLREKQHEQVRQAISNLESESRRIQEHRKKHQLLVSVTEGLYIEIDKLAKKSPIDQITDFELEHVNEVIKDTKELIKDDSYIQKLQVFVPAGDLPQLRNVRIALRQIKQGLERFTETLNTNVGDRLAYKRRMESALELALNGDSSALEKLESKDDSLSGINTSDFELSDPIDFLGAP